MNDAGLKPGAKKYIRQEWIDACHFHPMGDREVLREVARQTAATAGAAAPLVLLDLDSTLYEVGPRTHFILKEWMQSPEARPHAQVRAALERMEQEHVGYSVRDTLLALGFPVEKVGSAEMVDALESIKNFWASRFFTSEYLKHDRAYPGASEFARAMHERGAHLIYLTGRDEPGMGDGTRDNLLRDGFPWEKPRTHLLLKRTFHEPDLEHKKAAATYVKSHGQLVASFENEPPNIVALYDIFPQAMHVFVDTVYSDHPAEARQGLYKIESFAHLD